MSLDERGDDPESDHVEAISEDKGIRRRRLAEGMVDLALDMLEENTHDYLVIWAGSDGQFYYSSPNKTWAIGALVRAGRMLDDDRPGGDGAKA